MVCVRVEETINKKIEDVFEAISDHGSYTKFAIFDDAKLLEVGENEKNGKGALRQFRSGKSIIRERITHFDRPVRMDYLIQSMEPSRPLRHDRGEITLTAQGDKTHVLWISEGKIQIPIIGWLAGKIIERRMSKIFLGMLRHIDEN